MVEISTLHQDLVVQVVLMVVEEVLLVLVVIMEMVLMVELVLYVLSTLVRLDSSHQRELLMNK